MVADINHSLLQKKYKQQTHFKKSPHKQSKCKKKKNQYCYLASQIDRNSNTVRYLEGGREKQKDSHKDKERETF